MSFGLDPESNDFNWIPAFAGMTASELMQKSVGGTTLERFEKRPFALLITQIPKKDYTDFPLFSMHS